MRILQILGLPPPTMTFEHDRAEEDSVAKNPADFQRPLLITPCLGGLILLIWSHAFGGIMAALAWTALALVLAKASFKLVRRRVQRVLPALTEIESFELTCSVLAPLWIAEPLRMVLASGFFIAGKSDPMTVFRVSRPDEWLGELITGVAIILV